MINTSNVFKIVEKIEWKRFITCKEKHFFRFNGDNEFIHLSTYDQLLSTYMRKYSVFEKHNFQILEILHDNNIKWRYSQKNNMVYPYMTGQLTKKKLMGIYSLEHFPLFKRISN